jgi:hypothetical protein
VLGLFFSPENVGDVFFWNAGWLSVDYTSLFLSWKMELFITTAVRTSNLMSYSSLSANDSLSALYVMYALKSFNSWWIFIGMCSVHIQNNLTAMWDGFTFCQMCHAWKVDWYNCMIFLWMHIIHCRNHWRDHVRLQGAWLPKIAWEYLEEDAG